MPAIRKSISGINYPKLVLEFFSVFIGVVLAFAVSAWQEEQKDAEASRYVLTGVYYEIRGNLRILRNLNENNKGYVDSIEKSDQREDEREFYPGTQLLETSWALAQSENLAYYVTVETLSKLYGAYSQISAYKVYGERLADSSLDLAAHATIMEKEIDPRRYEDNYLPYFQTMIVFEKSLIEQLGQLEADVLAELELM